MSEQIHQETNTELESLLAQAREDEHGEKAEPDQEQEPQGPSTDELLLPLIAMACNVFAPNWAIQPEEQQTLSGAYAAVLDKYFPGGMEFGVELNALLITAAIVGPRVNVPLRKREEKVVNPNETEENASSQRQE